MRFRGNGNTALAGDSPIEASNIFQILGLAVAGIGGATLAWQRQYRLTAHKVKGHVIHCEYHRTPGHAGGHHLTIQFELPDGTAHKFTAVRDDSQAYIVGRVVDVYYAPGHPAAAQLGDDKGLETQITLIDLGLLAFLIATACYFS